MATLGAPLGFLWRSNPHYHIGMDLASELADTVHIQGNDFDMNVGLRDMYLRLGVSIGGVYLNAFNAFYGEPLPDRWFPRDIFPRSS